MTFKGSYVAEVVSYRNIAGYLETVHMEGDETMKNVAEELDSPSRRFRPSFSISLLAIA